MTGALKSLLLAVAIAVAAFDANAQGVPSHLKFEHSGVAIDVSTPKGAVSDEQALQALEEAARQLRKRIEEDRKQLPALQDDGIIPQANPEAFAGLGLGEDECEEASRRDQRTLWLFPRTLLWQPPLANPTEPRMYAKLTTLHNANTHHTVETAIGKTAGIYRLSPVDDPNHGTQVDFFAVVFTRFSGTSHLVAADYRFGLPITFAWGNWQAKVAYEHTSSHLGDDFILNHGRFQWPHLTDEVTFGLAYRFFNELRVYGIYGYPMSARNPSGTAAQHFDWGVEWSRQVTTGIRGQPFAAFDMEVREEQDYNPNCTAQVGWQWLDVDNARSLRIALELHDGLSEYGEFYLDRERWASLGVYFEY